MRTIYLFLIAFFLGHSAYNQTQISQYVLDFSDPTTYQVTCGSVNSAQWTVNSGTCTLYTPILTPADTGTITANYTIRINQKGNMSYDDKLYFQIKVGYNDWYTDTILHGNVASNVRDISGSLELEHNDFVVFRFVAEINTNGFWAIKNGDILVNNVTRGNFLPVTLASFSGYSENNQAQLEWVTYSETNNNYFSVERSDDGYNFYSVGNVSGAGNSNVALYYSFTDENALNNDYTYYRLRQTDYDGTTDYSNPIMIKNESEQNSNVWVYQEGAEVYVNYEASLNEDISVFVHDISGKIIDSRQFAVGRGFNTLELGNLNSAPVGLYIVRIIDSASQVHSLKLIL